MLGKHMMVSNRIRFTKGLLLDIPQIGCTACKYCCDGCPMNISIPDVFRVINTMTLYNEDFRPRSFYNGLVGAVKLDK